MNQIEIAPTLWARAKICDMWLTSPLPSSTDCTFEIINIIVSSSFLFRCPVCVGASVPSVLLVPWFDEFDLIRRAPFVTQFGGLVGQRLGARERASMAVSPQHPTRSRQLHVAAVRVRRQRLHVHHFVMILVVS